METEAATEEDARGNTGGAAATEEAIGTDEPPVEEAAKAAGAAAEEGTGGRTDGPEAAGASDAAPTTDPAPAAAGTGAYLEAGNGIFIQLPWASTSRAPAEGEVFDGEVLASAGLKFVDAPGSSSEPEEEQLLRKLLALYRAM